MSITLGGVTLPNLEWEGELEWTGVASSVSQTLGGRSVVWEQEVQSRLIDLVGGPNTGAIARSVFVSLRDLASVAGATYDLIYNGTTYTVRFRNEDAPPIEAEPLGKGMMYQDSGYIFRNLRIKLMEVD